MSLRARLAASFAVLALVPLAVTAFFLARAIPSEFDARLQARLVAAREAVVQQIDDGCNSLRQTAEQIARAVGNGGARAAVASAHTLGLVDRVVILDARGRTVAGGIGADLRTLSADGGCPRQWHADQLVARVDLLSSTGTPAGRVVVSQGLDIAGVRKLVGDLGVDLTIGTSPSQLVSTAPTVTARDVLARALKESAAATQLTIGRTMLAGRRIPGSGTDLVVVLSALRRSPAALQTLLASSVALIVLLMGFVGLQLARLSTRPLTELADAARRIAGGELDTHIEVTSRDEVGRLAVAFNSMTDELVATIRDLEKSRDEIRGNMDRLGEALAGTHDLDRILPVIVDTAMTSARAESGALFLLGASRSDVYLKVGRGMDHRWTAAGAQSAGRIRLGEGVTGVVAASGEPLLVGSRPESPAIDESVEPGGRTLISMPLKSSSRVIGVLNLYDRSDGRPFDDQDFETIRTFANQATVAIENVLLHEEAERLSITDGLTGLWNYRYLTMALSRDIERASRFDRPLGLLMLDLDHFKQVNDSFGHQRGDAVLIEVARRVKGVIRDIDVLARYGGEELVLLLPETDTQGAGQLAERVVAAIHDEPFGERGETPVDVTVSVGVAVYPHHGSTSATLLRAADDALYAAKSAGRNCWRVAET